VSQCELITYYAKKWNKVKNEFPLRTARSSTSASLPALHHTYVIRVPAGAIPQAVLAFSADPHVAFVQPDYAIKASTPPNDPYYSTQGSWGQPYDDLWALKADKMQLEPAWAQATGSGVTVSVIDTGLDIAHPDIAPNVWTNPGEVAGNGIDDDGNGFIDDVHGWDFALDDNTVMDGDGHGTHVSGIIAAEGNNAIGIIGMAPDSKLMPVKGLDDAGIGWASDLAEAIVYAATEGADVLNNSWGCSYACPGDPVLESSVQFAFGMGAVVVFAAGNSDYDIVNISPQNMFESLTVAASDHTDNRAWFSNYGWLLDVAAPGSGTQVQPPELYPHANILSLLSSEGYWAPELHVGNGYLRLAGTSMAAPYVAGLAALVIDRWPALTNEQVKQAIKASSEDIGSAGFDPLTGAGRIYAPGAVALSNALEAQIHSPLQGFVPAQAPITGSAWGGAFSAYELASRPLAGGSWNVIFADDTPVQNGLLGTWDTTGWPSGPYLIKLVAANTSGQFFYDYSQIYVDAWHKPGWPVKVASRALTPAIADVDGDGDLEVVVETIEVTTGPAGIWIYHHDGTPLENWSPLVPYGLFFDDRSPLLVDLDQNGDLEILYPTEDERVMAVDRFGQPVMGNWPHPSDPETDYSSYALVACNCDGDPQSEVAWATGEKVFLVDHHGDNLASWPITVDRWSTNENALAAADLDDDGDDELIIGVQDAIRVYRANASMPIGWPRTISGLVTFIAVGDTTTDKEPEVFAITDEADGLVHGLNASGVPLPGWPVLAGAGLKLWGLALGDIDGDGDLEVLVGHQLNSGSTNRVYAWHHDGTPVSGWPVNLPVEANEQTVGITGIAIADVTADGIADVLIQPRAPALFAYSGSGQLLPGYPRRSIGQVQISSGTQTPAIGDLDLDGQTDVVAAFTQGGGSFDFYSNIHVWQVPAAYQPQQQEWPMFGHDARLSFQHAWSDDELSPILRIEDATASEDQGDITFTVTLHDPLSDSASQPTETIEAPWVSVDYVTANGTAVSGSDYVGESGQLLFAIGQTSKTITVQLIDDAVGETDEHFYVNLSNPTGGAVIEDGQALGGIEDDDLEPTLSINDVTVLESAGSAVFTVSLSHGNHPGVWAAVELRDVTAVLGSDWYDYPSRELWFEPGQTTQQVSVALMNDSVSEPTETLAAELYDAESYYEGYPIDTGTCSILDDDALVDRAKKQ